MEIGKRIRLGFGVVGIVLAMTGTAAAQTNALESTGDLAFGRSIALIRGHLLAGEELVKLREWSAAYPHFTFPREEIYGVIREDLHSYHTPPFDYALKALAYTVRAHNARQYPKALAKVEAALAAADSGLKQRQRDWTKFRMAVAVEVLKAAAEEYENSVEDGRVAHAVGYRTARGFILQADHMIESAAAASPAGNAAALADIRSELIKIKEAFPGPRPPERLTVDEKSLDQAVSRIELSIQKLEAGRQI